MVASVGIVVVIIEVADAKAEQAVADTFEREAFNEAMLAVCPLINDSSLVNVLLMFETVVVNDVPLLYFRSTQYTVPELST